MKRFIFSLLLISRAITSLGAGNVMISHDAAQDTCAAVSTLPCTALKVSLPYSLSFNTPIANTINDKTGQGTGFTTVNTYSGVRLSADGLPPFKNVPGYDPSKISLTNGVLQIVAHKGIDFQTNNNQLNVLGVQIQPSGKVQLEVKIINPYNNTQSQQGGLWYGLNDKTYLKLGVTGNKIEFRKEVNDVTSTVSGTTNPDQRLTSVITGLSTKTVTLRLVIDSTAQTAEGFYSTDGVNFSSAGATGYPNSSLNIQNSGLASGILYAGIFTTYRNGTSPVTYTFDDFSVKSIAPQVFNCCAPLSTLNCAALKVNLPFGLSFDAAVPGSINDKNGQGTGFTTVNTYTGTRLVADGQPSLQQVPGYEPSKISVGGGRLQLVANKGIDYQSNNNQLNVLGVQFQPFGLLQLDVKIVNPYNGTQSQQGGIWYGLNDKTYIKLGVTGNRVELRRELNDVTSTVTGTTNPDQRITPVISGLSTKEVLLKLVIDSAEQTAEGFYCIDGVNYISTGSVGYASRSMNIQNSGLASGLVYAGLFATYRNGTSAVTYTFDDFNISARTQNVVQPPSESTLTFSKDTLKFTVLKGADILPQAVKLLSNPSTHAFTLAKTTADWLTLPTNPSDSLKFGPQNISANMPAGNYQALITYASEGYKSATLLITLDVVENLIPKTVNVNFQNAQTVPPGDYFIDYGQAYGDRLGQYQGALLRYGWRKRADGTALNLVGNGRLRTLPEDILLATVFHMQANNISGTFQGVKTEGYWEIEVPNGTYDATVSVGDGNVSTAPEYHYLNVEGVNAITNFKPIGKQGDIGRFKSNTIRVTVADEHLTINADGGTNTKINFANIVPVSTAPYLYWETGNKNLTFRKGTNQNTVFEMVLSSSNNQAGTYQVSITFPTGSPAWLSAPATVTGTQPKIPFNYSAAKNLNIGIYYATIRATSATFTSADVLVQINVVDDASPYVIATSPANGARDVSLNTVSIAANSLHVPAVAGYQGGVDNQTINDTTVKLYKQIDTSFYQVKGTVQGTGGGDAISFSPSSSLEPYTQYKFVIISAVKSYPGAAFAPYEMKFTTGPAVIDSNNFLNAQFKKIPIPGTQNIKYSSLAFGPDGKFYALRFDGLIERFTVNHSDGSLSDKQTLYTMVSKYGSRTAIGLAFDPQSTPTNPILWVSHSSGGLTAGPMFDGNISRLSGDSLQNEQLMVTKLPRSTRDHMVNSVNFGPDGALYICQGSNTSAGDYDADWQRDETLLSGTILRLDVGKLNAMALPLNAQTTSNQALINAAPTTSAFMSDGTYNPYGSESPLTIYASGVRNAYDLVWHTNGQLYIPTNGSGGGGNSPASVMGTRRPNGTFYSGPAVEATKGVKVQDDWLFRVNPNKSVGYFGHPNPLRGEYVINRGFTDNPLYSPAVNADSNYGAAYDFGLNHSPNGALEYKSNNFNGALKGKLLVCRFSGGGDIVVMEPGSIANTIYPNGDDQIYDIVKVTNGSANSGLVGMSGFTNPLDIAEDVTNGNLYVSEFNWNDNPNLTAQITLLKAQSQPSAPVAKLAVAANLDSPVNEYDSKNYWITIANQGDGTLKIKNISLNGDGATKFKVASLNLPSVKEPLIIKKNSSISFKVNSIAAFNRSTIARLIVTTMGDTTREVQIDNIRPEENAESIKAAYIANTQQNTNAALQPALMVYPNPNHGEPVSVAIKNLKPQEAINIYLYNRNGRQLKVMKANADGNGAYSTTFIIDESEAVGFYLVRAEYAGGSKVSKVIVFK
ncbi:Ig-like domain-containing protein [Mucilaginibacter psychrotolerans]|uniref:T9SS type A sorting domain-containing protein n=1 Tax=Mucilaginibacter psychrotolerans TaxID=1524096 RepID=A0A4Y8SN71_9SPHI|nr:Ig-like domain-containing protein [Mucilaginibacter psychrotolerans]TFF39844.1 T9SS type A sorting domain-containing protein [Mucilaginibacter psychrotolerans]